jgi:hypothetical protein
MNGLGLVSFASTKLRYFASAWVIASGSVWGLRAGRSVSLASGLPRAVRRFGGGRRGAPPRRGPAYARLLRLTRLLLGHGRWGPGDLARELEAASVAHFGLYDNRGEGFHDRRGVGALSPEVLQSPRPVHRTLSRVARGGILVPSHPELDATYVDYEVSPTRTTAAQYESGAPCRAKGGIDVLLANARDRLPVVAEAKGAMDRNLFLGLIQALTYAVELSTAPQRERLARTYPGRFGELLWVGLPAP